MLNKATLPFPTSKCTLIGDAIFHIEYMETVQRWFRGFTKPVSDVYS